MMKCLVTLQNDKLDHNKRKHSDNRGRDASVDFLKGWAMVSVVIFHQTSSLFLPWIENLMMNPWNVAVFFIVAGYYLKWSKLIHPFSFIKGKLKTLYIPATIIYLCAVLLHNLFVYVGWYPLITFGVFDSTSEMGMYTFAYGKNIVLLVLYTFMGLAVPLLIVAIKNKIQNFCAGCHYKLL